MNARALPFISMTRRENGPGHGLDSFHLLLDDHQWAWDNVRRQPQLVADFMEVALHRVVRVDIMVVALLHLVGRRLRNLVELRRLPFLQEVPCRHRLLLADSKGHLVTKSNGMVFVRKVLEKYEGI